MITSPLPIGTKYYTPGVFHRGSIDTVTWGDDPVDMYLLRNNLAFETKDEILLTSIKENK